MPVKTNKRNARKQQHNEPEDMYSNSIIDLDDSGTSPPLYIPPPNFRPLSPLSEPEPDSGRETMTYNLHGFDDDEHEPPLVSPAAVAHPQAVSLPPQPPPVNIETWAQREVMDTPAVSQAGHVRSPILAR